MSTQTTFRLAFSLNGESITADVAPSERLLDLLRYRLGLAGTKEGCGEGECGACAVLLDGLPVNSCLVPAFQARGRRVETVEAAAPAELDELHASGATQCGACTPGVVITAWWLRRNPELARTMPLRQLMAGNLCRCTGYDGIIEGVEAWLARAETEPAERRSAAAGAAAPMRAGRGSGASNGAGSVLTPTSLAEACELLAAHPEAVPIAGGTDALVHWPLRIEEHGVTFLDLSGVDELRPLRWTDEELVLGGLTTYWDVIRDERAASELPLLVEAARQVGAIQIQARGTWAGNIVNASPAADGVPVLMAYDAVVVLASARGRETVPLRDFYLGYKRMRRDPDQLVVEIRVPRRSYELQLFEKVGTRAAQAIAKVGAAVTRCDGEWRVVASSVAPTVCRCPTLEAFLTDERPASGPDDLLGPLREDVSPIDDIRSTARYREQVLARLLYYGLRETCPHFA